MSEDSSEKVLEDGLGFSEGDEEKEPDYVRLAENAYKSSTDYVSANLQRQWERNLANFLSRHPPGSKYRTDAYKYRSRLFRPKSRSTVRSKEAAMVLALFSTSDFVNIEATDQSDPAAVDSARVMSELVGDRLLNTIPWFRLVVGGTQDAQVMGSVISHQYWDYEERKIPVPARVEKQFNPKSGAYVDVEIPQPDEVEVLSDKPVIELIENENFRIDPGASWIDPINTSPYIIHLIPMYVVDVLDRMKRADSKTGQPAWKKLTVAQIIAATSTRNDTDATRLAREGTRQDPKSDHFTTIDNHMIVWVHRNIMRFPGEGDKIWYTLGVKELLSDPVPLEEVYLHGQRPYTMGHAVLEAHRSYPSSIIELGQDMQSATNDNLNQRFDNVRQVLNKRYFVRRGSTADLVSLRRNVPGSITMMGDIEKDVKWHETSDVTSSSYQEQNLFNADYDEVTGQFSPGSVQGNRELGETVGGMRMLKDPSNTMTEYIVRTICETWVKALLKQLVALEQAYETDAKIIQAAGRAAKVAKVPRDLMKQALNVGVNVGFGVTDPQARVGRLLYGLSSVSKMAPKVMTKLKEDEVLAEIFGILGYQDGSRFFMDEAEFTKYQQANPAPPGEVQLKIQSQEKIEMAKLELQRLIAEATLMVDERKKAAELAVQVGAKLESRDLELGKRDIDIQKLDLERLGLTVKREDMLRKDAEIGDVERPKKNRSGGGDDVK